MPIVFGSPQAKAIVEADKNYIPNLSLRLADVKKRINRLQEDISDLEDEIGNKERRIDELEQEAEAIQDEIDSEINAYGEEAGEW